MKSILHSIYVKFTPELVRKYLYVLRNRSYYERLRTEYVSPSKYGKYSLSGFDKTKSIFIHIPKAAGTSISYSLYGHLTDHYTAYDYINIFGRQTYKEYYKFAFVRNPWDRLFSAYNFLIKGGWSEADRLWAERNISQYKDFRDFVRSWITTKNINSHIHFIPQYRFICNSSGSVIIDHVAYFENINEEFEKIADILDINCKLAAKNVTGKDRYIDHYDDEIQEIVAQVYTKDIELLNYKFTGSDSDQYPHLM